MKDLNSNEDARRAYWAEQMDAATAFMQAINDFPVAECGEPVVPLVEAVRAAGVDVRFSARPHVRGLPRLFWLREGLLGDFLACARDLNARGWAMTVEDGFRTVEMQKFLARQPYTFDVIVKRVIWECGGLTPSLELVTRRVNALVASAPKVGTHMSGSAIDISVHRIDNGAEVDRGGPYIEMSERTPMPSPFVSDAARANRVAITELMARHGFVAYPWEFWHYSSGDAYDQFLRRTGKPALYGPVDWDPVTGAVTPLERPDEPLNSESEVRAEILAALDRLSCQNGSATTPSP
jgi:D-alanyl-D-alanine dipeptidase